MSAPIKDFSLRVGDDDLTPFLDKLRFSFEQGKGFRLTGTGALDYTPQAFEEVEKVFGRANGCARIAIKTRIAGWEFEKGACVEAASAREARAALIFTEIIIVWD